LTLLAAKYDNEIIHRPNPKIEGDLGGNFKLTILIVEFLHP